MAFWRRYKWNRKSIGAEICYSKSGGGRYQAAEVMAIKFVVQLLKERGWGVERIRTGTANNARTGFCLRDADQGRRPVLQELERLSGEKASSPAKTKTKASGATYTVKKGDALSVIAQKIGGSMANFQKWNNIMDPNKIKVGQVLKLTGSSSGKKYVRTPDYSNS